MNFIQLNKFSKLHNGSTIIFCKTDFIFNEFEYIKNLPNDVILITGNSDYPITETHIKNIPKNIKKWFAQNALVNSDILIPLPIGLENKEPSVRIGHGIGYHDRMIEKESLLNTSNNITPKKFIYANFNVETNFEERVKYRDMALTTNHIDWECDVLLKEYFNKILEYKMILCPIGNGIDTHRLWEVLYSGRVPITVKVGDYKIYELYNKLPIIVLDNIDELKNKSLIENKYNEIMGKVYNSDILLYDYWEYIITK